MEDFIILHNLDIKGNPPKSPSIIQVTWNPPPTNWTKLNIDGAAKGAPGHAGCGGIFRTCRGFVEGCFAVYIGIKFAFEAEIMGFILAIEAASKFNWNNLWVETDSSLLVWLFKAESQNVPWRIRNRWVKALHQAKLRNVIISHTFREGNCVADKLASIASIPGTKEW